MECLDMMPTVTLTLARARVHVVGAALTELPFRLAATLLDEIDRWLREQAPKPVPVPEAS